MDWKFNVYIILNSYCNICFLCFLDIKIKMYTWWLQQAWNFKLYTRVFHHSLVIKRSTNWALCWSLVTKFIWYIYIYIYDENRIFFLRSPHHNYFGKAQHLVLWAWCTETKLSIPKRSVKEDVLSVYIIHKHLLCNLFILLFNVRLWNIHYNGQ